MVKIHLDFETRSEADIKEVGAYEYSKHPSTEILCACFAYEDMGVRTVRREGFLSAEHNSWPDLEFHLMALYGVAVDDSITFTAHNAFFEQCIWQNIMVPRYGFPKLPPNRWTDTMAKVLSHGLPKALENAAIELGLEQRKDGEGKKIMLKMSKPAKSRKRYADEAIIKDDRITGFKTHLYDEDKWHEAPEDFEKLYAYCAQDVKVERAIDKMLPDLRPMEQKIWEIDQSMNMRGVPVDLELIEKAIVLANEYGAKLKAELYSITGGMVDSHTKRAAFLNWLKIHGLDLPDFTKETVRKIRERTVLPPYIERALEIKTLLAKTSVAKYEKFKAMLSADHSVRGMFTYHSASTGRWGSNGVQLQNLARPDEKTNTDIAAECILNLDLPQFEVIYPEVMNALSYCTRSVITAPDGEEFHVADYSSIESRGIAWLADQLDKLELFVRGECAYCHAASKIYGKEIKKKEHPYERQVGKVSELALGYQGGIAAYAQMARAYNLDIEPVFDIVWPTATPEEQNNAMRTYKMYAKSAKEPLSERAGMAADIIKQRWRKANPMIVQFWADQEEAAIRAIQFKGELVQAGKVYYQVLGDWLYCRLPSGRLLAYHRPELKIIETDWGTEKVQLRHMTLDSQTKKYIRTGTYGGKLAENLTQAICRDIMSEAMIRVENTKRYDIIMTVHDELVTEAVIGTGSHKELCNLMAVNPTWCPDFPIAVEGWTGKRYKK